MIALFSNLAYFTVQASTEELIFRGYLLQLLEASLVTMGLLMAAIAAILVYGKTKGPGFAASS